MIKEKDWYMKYNSSNLLTEEDKLFLSDYSEDYVNQFILDNYPDLINADKITIKDAVGFMRWCLED